MRDHIWLALTPSCIRSKLRGRHALQRVLGNTGWLIADKLIRLGFGLVIGVWVARYLGPTQFGLLNFAVAFVALFSTLSNLGLQNLIVRDLVAYPDRREALLGSALLMRLFGSGLAVVLAIATIILLRPHDRESITITAIVSLMLLPQAWDVIEFDYQSRIQARPIVLIRNASFLASCLVRLILISENCGLSAFACVTSAELVMAAALMAILARHQAVLPRLARATAAEIRRLLRTGWPLIVTSLSVVLYWRIDQVMLGQMSGDTSVGTFSAAVRLSEIWYFIPISVAASTAPVLTAAFHRSHAEYMRKLGSIMHITTMMGVAVAIMFTLLSGPIVLKLFGPRYVDAAPILAIHGWAGIFVAAGVISTSWFINLNRVKYSMYQTLCGAACNIALNYFLIPRYGGEGAAVATVITQIIATVLLNIALPETRELFRMQTLSFLPRWAFLKHG